MGRVEEKSVQYFYEADVEMSTGNQDGEIELKAHFDLSDYTPEKLVEQPYNPHVISAHGKTPEAALKAARDNRAKYLALKAGVA